MSVVNTFQHHIATGIQPIPRYARFKQAMKKLRRKQKEICKLTQTTSIDQINVPYVNN